MGRTHGAWGIAAGAGMAAFVAAPASGSTWWVALVGVLLAGVGSLMPDMDSPEALIQELPAEEGRKSHSLILAVLGWLVSLVVKILSWIVRLFTRHRAATHTVWAVLVGALLVGVIGFLGGGVVPLVRARETFTVAALFHAATAHSKLVQLGYLVGVFALGASTHLFLDALTVEGIRPFAPLWNAHICLAHMKTGGGGDAFLRRVGDIATGLFLLVYLYKVAVQAGWIPALEQWLL